MSRFLPIAFTLLLTFRLAAGPLDDLKLNFETRCDFAAADRDQQLKKLDASYLAALDRLVEKARATGKLDAVIPLIEEVQSVKTATTPLPELPASASAELKQMRTKHAEASAKILKSHAEAITALATKMKAALKSQEEELTKAGNIRDALAAKKMREDLENNSSFLVAKDMLAKDVTPNLSGRWTNLLKEEMVFEKTGDWDPCILSSINPNLRVFKSFLDTLKLRKESHDEILMAHAPALVKFKSQTSFSSFRSNVFLANPQGSVEFVVKVGNKKVSAILIEKHAKQEVIEVTFGATREITLETNPIDTAFSDWAAWIKPEIK